MNVADIFYIFGIIFFVSWIVLLVTVTVLAWKAYKAIEKLPETVKVKIQELNPLRNREGLLGLVGAASSAFILDRLKGFFRRKSS